MTGSYRKYSRVLLIFLLMVMMAFVAAASHDEVWAADEGYTNSCLYWNANAQNYGGGHILSDVYHSSTVRSFLIPCDDGRLMRVHSYKGSKKVLVEYYDKDLKLVESTTKSVGLANPGTIYADGDFYYVVTGQRGLVAADKEILHIAKYDESWKFIKSTGIKGFTDTMAFYDQPVRVAEINGYLLIRTAIYQGGHNVSFEAILNKDSMEVVADTRTGTVNVMGFTSHCFDSYIGIDGNDVITCEIRDGDISGALLTRREFDPENGNYTGYRIQDDYQGYMLKGNGCYDSTGNCCGVSVGGFEISENKYIAVGTTIDQKNISTSRTRNVYIAVADRDVELEDRLTFQEHEPGNDDGQVADIKMLTSYKEGTEIANTPHLVPLGGDKYLVIWSRYGALYPNDDESGEGTVYYQMIDGDGNLVGKQYSFKGMLSDCKPVIYNGNVLWYVRASGMMKFYMIDASDISKHSAKNIPIAKEHLNTRIDCFTPATFDDYGYTGYPHCKDCGNNLDRNHTIREFGWYYISDDRSYDTNKLVYSGKVLKPYLAAAGDVKAGVDYTLDIPAAVKNVGTYKAKLTLIGNYTGSRTIKFKVIPAKPKSTVKGLKRKVRITMKKKAAAYGADKFQIKYKTPGKKWKVIETTSTKKVLKKLKKGKWCDLKLRTCKTVNGKKYYSEWSYKSVKVK